MDELDFFDLLDNLPEMEGVQPTRKHALDFYEELPKEVVEMQKQAELEAVILKCAEYYLDYGWTIREIAENTGLSKSTVGYYLKNKLGEIDTDLMWRYKFRNG